MKDLVKSPPMCSISFQAFFLYNLVIIQIFIFFYRNKIEEGHQIQGWYTWLSNILFSYNICCHYMGLQRDVFSKTIEGMLRNKETSTNIQE